MGAGKSHSERDRRGIIALILSVIALIPIFGLLYGVQALVLVLILLVQRRANGWTIASIIVLVVAGVLQYWVLSG